MTGVVSIHRINQSDQDMEPSGHDGEIVDALGNLGARIRGIRTEQGLTLPELSQATSVSTSMLSAVERSQKSPTITVLARIARGLGIPLSQLVADRDDHRVLVRRVKQQDVVEEPGGWRRVIVSPVVPGVNFELIRTTLPPGCDAGEFPAYASGSHEYVVVEEGTLRVTVAGTIVDRTRRARCYCPCITCTATAMPTPAAGPQ